MLRVVRKKFDIGNNITVMPEDIVDVSEWKNLKALEEHGFVDVTGAKKATINPNRKESSTASYIKPPVVKRRRPLASHPRVFTRKAKHGD